MKRRNIKQIIKEYFFINPTIKLRVREIERKLKLPLPSIIRYCSELEKEKILTRVIIGKVVFYAANRSSEMYLLEKKLFNIKSLYISGLVKFIKEELSNPTIIVFGSYAKGEDIETSDIDLYIETPSRKEINLKFEKTLKRKIQVFKHEKLAEIKNKHLMNNIINGITLNGFLEAL